MTGSIGLGLVDIGPTWSDSRRSALVGWCHWWWWGIGLEQVDAAAIMRGPVLLLRRWWLLGRPLEVTLELVTARDRRPPPLVDEGGVAMPVIISPDDWSCGKKEDVSKLRGVSPSVVSPRPLTCSGPEL